MKQQHSLQKSLNRWILLSTLAFALLAGVTAGLNAYHEAREYQDMHLQQMGELLQTGSVRPETGLVLETESTEKQRRDERDDILMILQLDRAPERYRHMTAALADGLHTLDWDGHAWRTLLITQPPTSTTSALPGRFAVAQLTEVRNELALESALRSGIPMLLLTPVLLLLVHRVIRYHLSPVAELARKVDARHEHDLTPLEGQRIPQELSPFLHSINHLLIRVEQNMAQQRRFVADAAHELRTPLTALSLLTENVARAPDLQSVRERLQPLQESQQRMQTLVTQLLGLARLQGHRPDTFKPASLSACVQGVVADLYPLAEARRIDLGVSRQTDLMVTDTEGGLALLVRNALENALHYTPMQGQVDIELYREGGDAVLRICDNGPGIPDSELERVFEPFHRAAVNTAPGSGLGLTISREIALRLGGHIRLQNRPAGGLCFCYRQPIVDPSGSVTPSTS
ncbi:MAG: sensor histidine kinase [Thiothrix sp.]|nr:sensor histidine kinase [Thiothrix sp.]HPE62040.1 ATP-binding protein [Thiolinea sp.]